MVLTSDLSCIVWRVGDIVSSLGVNESTAPIHLEPICIVFTPV